MRLQLFAFDVATDRFPEITDFFGDSIPESTLGTWTFFREELSDNDSENFLIFADRSLVMDENKRFPSYVIEQMQHTERCFQFVDLTMKARNGFSSHFVKLFDAFLVERGQSVTVFLDVRLCQYLLPKG
ncbi:MAG: hypothetical protein LBI87_07730 [Candidatus Accumulibacter sp.]|nr:hypothetical protein [Accumulibacter sp.]